MEWKNVIHMHDFQFEQRTKQKSRTPDCGLIYRSVLHYVSITNAQAFLQTGWDQ